MLRGPRDPKKVGYYSRLHIEGRLYVGLVSTTIFISMVLGNTQAYSQVRPYPGSPVITDVTWDVATHRTAAEGSDNWPTTWADDDHLYTSWGDGTGFNGTRKVTLGVARVEGPWDNYTGTNVWTGAGKSYGLLSVAGILYMWVNIPQYVESEIRWSSDHAKTWTTGFKFAEPDVAFSVPTFLNFGKDYQGARDGYVYVYSGLPIDGCRNRCIGYDVDLARVPKEKITDRASYEFFSGLDAEGNPIWTSDIKLRNPVFSDPNGAGTRLGVVYNPGIKRYLMSISHNNAGGLGIFDAPEPWGPWTTVAYYDNWLGFGYSPSYHIAPSKWMSADGKDFVMVWSSYDRWNTIRGSFSIEELTVSNVTPKGYHLGRLDTGDLAYVDTAITVTGIPAELEGLIWVRTAADDQGRIGSDVLQFDVNTDVNVFLGYAAGVSSLPGWMSDWSQTGSSLQLSNGSLNVYQKNFPAGRVVIGGNEGASMMYVVLLRQDTATTVPVEMQGLEVKVDERYVKITWRTVTETNNYGFEIERKEPQTDFLTVGFVRGHGTSSTPNDYEFVDSPDHSGYFDYRLKQIDTDGSFSYSDVVSVHFQLPVKSELFQNFPNPFNSTTDITYTIKEDQPIQLAIYTVSGKLVRTLVNTRSVAGTYIASWDGKDSFGREVSSGIYLCSLNSREHHVIRKLVLVK